MRKRQYWTLVLLAVFAVVTERVGFAQQGFPVRPVRIVVPFAAGGPADFVARILSQKLSETWGQSVVIDNRGGAGGNIGTELVAKAAPDGYTVLLTSSVFICNPSLYQKTGYDPFKDFAPVTLIGVSGVIVVRHPSYPAKSMQDIAQLAKSSSVNYASPGIGTAGHLAAELFRTYAKVGMQQVPFKGAAPAIGAMLGGEVRLGFMAVPPAVPHVKSGRLAAVAVTSPKRLAELPDVPTVAESGYPGFQVDNMYGLLVPRAASASIVKKLNADAVRVLKQPDVASRLAADTFEVVANTPEEFSRYLKAEYVKWAKVVKETGARVD